LEAHRDAVGETREPDPPTGKGETKMNHKQFNGLHIAVGQPLDDAYEVVFWSPLGERTVTIDSIGMPCEDLEDILTGINNAPEMAGILDVDPDEVQEILDELTLTV
jgi:hypothetical protein